MESRFPGLLVYQHPVHPWPAAETQTLRPSDPQTSFIWPQSPTSGLLCNHRARQISCCYNWQWIARSKLKAGLCGKIGFLCRYCDKTFFTQEVTGKDFIVSISCRFFGKGYRFGEQMFSAYTSVATTPLSLNVCHSSKTYASMTPLSGTNEITPALFHC